MTRLMNTSRKTIGVQNGSLIMLTLGRTRTVISIFCSMGGLHANGRRIRMKVFIYSKRESKPFAVLTNVHSVEEHKEKICFIIDDATILEVDKKHYKSTAYQN